LERERAGVEVVKKLFEKQEVFAVPEGQLIIAQQFIAGNWCG
jgi:hypothetical protein